MRLSTRIHKGPGVIRLESDPSSESAFFIERLAPVPQFLMLDQPSQVWFPAEVAKVTGQSAPAKDADLAAVKRVYEFLIQVAKGPHAPQIIVSDHARLEDRAFKSATIEDWHDNEGLVPSSWQL